MRVDSTGKPMGERGCPGLIIGNRDEMKGYRVYIQRDKVVVTQHVSSVEILSDAQIKQLKRMRLGGSESEETSEKKKGAKKQLAGKDAPKNLTRGQNKNHWTRDRHLTRSKTRKSVAKLAQQSADIGHGGSTGGVVNSVREADIRNYSQAMKSKLKEKWLVAMEEELRATQENQRVDGGGASDWKSRFAHQVGF